MADKLNTFTSNLIKFVAGERPSADKFNAANEFFSRNIRDISRAIGDMYGVGYPHLSDLSKDTHLTGKWNPHEIGNRSGRPLDISSLSRIIGPASNLNPKMVQGAKVIQEIIPSGVAEYQLKFKSVIFDSLLVGGITGFNQINPSENFTSGNQFKIIKNSIIFNSPLSSDVTITYSTNPNLYFGGPNYLNATFNVIPDPNQETKLTVSEQEDGSYLIDLNEIKITNQQSGLVDLTLSSTNAEPNANQTMTLPYWMWSTEDGEALFEEGTVIPEGLLYVKDLTSNECFLTATYTFVSKTELKISGVSLCLDDEYQIVVTGTDITTSIDDLRNKWFLHKHDGTFGEQRISIKDLVGKFIDTAPSGVYGESSNEWNQMPMYLHRDGFKNDDNFNNGHNAMRGNLLLGRNDFDPLDNTKKIDEGENSVKLLVGNSEHTVGLVNGELEINGTSGVNIKSEDVIDINAVVQTNVLSNNTVYVKGKEISHIDSEGLIKTSINGNDQTVQYEINGNTLAVENFSNGNPIRVNDKLKIYSESNLVKESFMNYIEVKPSTNIDYSNSSPADSLDSSSGKLISLCNTALINGVEKTLHSENSYKFKVLDIENVYDNFYLDFKKNNFKESFTVFEDSRENKYKASSLETRFSTHSYYTSTPTIVEGFEDPGGDFFEPDNIKFRFIQARENIILNDSGIEISAALDFDLQNSTNERDIDYLWTEVSQRILINEWFNTELDSGGDHDVKKFLWVNFEATKNSGSLENISFRLLANLLNSDDEVDNPAAREYNSAFENQKTLGFLITRGNTYRWVPKSNFGVKTESVKDSYTDENRVNPDGDLLTQIAFYNLDSREVLMLEEDEALEAASINNSKDFYDFIQLKNINIYMTRRPYYSTSEERSVFPTIITYDKGLKYYDFLTKINENSKREENCYTELSIDGDDYHINKIGYLGANRFFVNIYRDIIINSNSVRKRKFIIDTFNNNLPIMQIYRSGTDSGQIKLLESVNFIWNLKETEETSVGFKEHEYLNLYKYGNGFETNESKNIIVKINGEKMLSYKCKNVNLSVLFYKYIKNKMVQIELSDFEESVASYDNVDGAESVMYVARLKKGFFEIKYILDVTETYYRNSVIVLDIKAEYDIKHKEDANPIFSNERLINSNPRTDS